MKDGFPTMLLHGDAKPTRHARWVKPVVRAGPPIQFPAQAWAGANAP